MPATAATLAAPGDRRRLAAYARMKGLQLEHAELGAPYDLAYVTYSSDLPGWVARKRREGDRLKLVFELIDAYFTELDLPAGSSRAPGGSPSGRTAVSRST